MPSVAHWSACFPTSSAQSEEPWRVDRWLVPQLCPRPEKESGLAPKTVLSDVPRALGRRQRWVLEQAGITVLACFLLSSQPCTSQTAQGRPASAAERNELTGSSGLVWPGVAYTPHPSEAPPPNGTSWSPMRVTWGGWPTCTPGRWLPETPALGMSNPTPNSSKMRFLFSTPLPPQPVKH